MRECGSALPYAERMRRRSWRVVAHTFAACLHYRVTGLAAEAAFFAILSLPPLIFGLAGADRLRGPTLRRAHHRGASASRCSTCPPGRSPPTRSTT